MTDWVSPFPDGLNSAKVFRPDYDVRRIADVIVERAWRGQGVRIYAWPDGTLAMVRVGSRADAVMLGECPDQLLVTYARHNLFGNPGPGPSLRDVVDQLSWARASIA